MQLVTRTLSGTAIAAMLAAPVLWAAGPAGAAGGRGVTDAGSCSQHGTFKLTAKHDNAAIEIEYEVDTNVSGQRFAVRLTDNGALIAKRSVTTAGPSGSFTVSKRTANRAGTDTIRARAVSGSNVCRGLVRL